MGTKHGSIIATIVTTHMPRNDAAAAGHVCPGIRIHAIDIVQPPGIGMPIGDMDPHQTIVPAVLAAKSSAETVRNACRDARSEIMTRRSALVVLVVAAEPAPTLVASERRPVEPGWTSRGVVGPEHEVIDEQLRAPSEEIRQ